MSQTQSAVAEVAQKTNAFDNIQNNLMSFVPMLMIFAVFYFLLIRPQEKKRKEHEALVGSVKKGEDILTHAGIYGTVEKINDHDGSLDLEIAKNVTIKVSKSSVADILNRKK